MKLGTLQAGRGVASVGVVLLHTADYFSQDPRFWMRPVFLNIFYFGRYGVSFFFILSGIVILLAHWKDQGRPSAWPSYAWKRIRRVYPIYWIVLIPVLLFHSQRFSWAVTPWSILSSLLLIHIGSPVSILLVGWSLFCEILFYILFSLVILNRTTGYLGLTAWFSGCLWFAFHPRPGLLFVYFLPVHLLFVFGMIITVIYKKRWISHEPILLSIGAGIVAFALYRASANRHSFEDVLAGLGFALFMTGLIGLEVKGRIRVSRAWLLLGDASYSIYLIHMPVLAIMTPKAHQSHLPVVVLFCLEASIAVMVGIALHLTVERKLLRTL